MASPLGRVIDRLILPIILLVLGTILLLNDHDEVGFLLIGTAIGVPARQRLSAYVPK